MSTPITGPLLTALLGVTLAACGGGDDDGAGADARPGAIDAGADAFLADAGLDCWPVEGSVARGSVQLGTGYEDFEPMPDTLQLVYGIQGGYHVEVYARTTGFEPGNPADPLDPGNPRTRFRTFFVDTGLPINAELCPSRLGYVPSLGVEGSYDIKKGLQSQFSTMLVGEDLFGIQVRVVVEVLDSTGSYATDEKIITCAPPPN